MWLALLTAFANPDSPARQCAEAAEGAEVEVCLKLATEQPDALHDLSAALQAHIDRGSSAERELLTAILLLMDDTTALKGIDSLVEIGDGRARKALLRTADHKEIPIALAAIEALGSFPSAHPDLARWVLDDRTLLPKRLTAIDALAESGRVEAADALVDTYRRRGLPPAVRMGIRNAILTRHPDRLGELQVGIYRSGTPWLTLTGTFALGSTLGVAGRATQRETAIVATGTGALAGGTIGYVLGRAFPIESDKASFVAINTLSGAGAGFAIGLGLDPERPQRALWMGLGGEAIGLGVSTLVLKQRNSTTADHLEAAGMGIAMAGLLGGSFEVGRLNGLANESSNRAPMWVGGGIGLAAGTTLGHLVTPNIRLERNDWALLVLATGTGAALGTFAPLGEGNRRGPLPLVGASAGFLGGYGLVGSIDPDWDALGSGTAGAVFGGLVLGGTAVWAKPGDRPLAGGAVLVGGIAGMGLGGLLADVDQDPIDDRDVVLATMYAGWTAAHVVALNGRTGRGYLSRPGPLLVLPSIAGATVAGLSPVLDVPIEYSAAGLSIGLWGAGLGASVGQIASNDPVVGGIIGGNVGIGIGTIALTPQVGLSPTSIAIADTGGILGGAAGLVIAQAASDGGDEALIGAATGATVGFVSGALLGRHLRRTGRTRSLAFHVPETLKVTVMPTSVQQRPGAVIWIRGW